MLAKVSGFELPMPRAPITCCGNHTRSSVRESRYKMLPVNEKSTATSDVILNKALTKPAYH